MVAGSLYLLVCLFSRSWLVYVCCAFSGMSMELVCVCIPLFLSTSFSLPSLFSLSSSLISRNSLTPLSRFSLFCPGFHVPAYFMATFMSLLSPLLIPEKNEMKAGV